MKSRLAEAIQLRNDGEFEEAISLLRGLIAERPASPEPHRRLSDWLAQLGREKDLRELLRNWSEMGGGLEKLEPLVRLLERLENSPAPVDSGEREFVKAKIESIKGKLLARAGADRARKLRILIAAKERQGVLHLLRQGSVEENTALKPNLLLAAMRLLDGATGVPLLSSLVDVDALCRGNYPNLLAHLARVAEQTGDDESQMIIDTRICQLDVQFETSFVRAAQRLTREGQHAKLEQLLAEWRTRFPDSIRRQRFEIDFELGHGRLEAAIAAATQSARLHGANAADFIRLSDLLLKNGDNRGALAIIMDGLARFPAAPKLLARAWQISSQLGDEAAATKARRQAQLYHDLNSSFIETIGEAALLAHGGRSAIHAVFEDVAASETATDGLIDLIELALASLRNYVAVRPGRRREAAELHELGAAQWKAVEPKAVRLGHFILALCHQAMLRQPMQPRILSLALETTLLLERDDRLTLSLCEALIPHYGSLAGSQREWLWQVVLGLPSSNESETILQKMCDAEPLRCRKTHHLRLTRVENAQGLSGAELFAQDSTMVRTPIRVFSEVGDQSVDLNVHVSAAHAFGPLTARIWAGSFVELASGETLCSDSNAGMARRNAAIAAVGTKHILVHKPGKSNVINEPLLFVPGSPGHYGAYFHFLGQTLPVILRMREWLDNPDLRIGIPDYAPRFVHELLAMAGVHPNEVLLLAAARPANVRELYTTAPCPLDFQAQPTDLMRLRDRLHKPKGRRRKQRKLFLSRPLSAVSMAGRSLINEAELEQLARTRGYEVVNPLEFSLAEQQDLFAGAATLCGPTGAALTNCVFMPPDGELICLSPRQTCRTYYPGMTLGSKQRFTWVLGSFSPDTDGARSFPHLPYYVSPDVLDRAL